MAGGDVCSSESFNEDIAVFSKQVRSKGERKEGKKSNLDKIPEPRWPQTPSACPFSVPWCRRRRFRRRPGQPRSVVRHLVSESKVDEGLITRREAGEGERWLQQ